MIELLFVTCLSATAPQGDSFRERSLVFTDLSPMTCMMGAQPQLAKWVEEHPGQQIKSWKCRFVNTGERKA